MSLDVDPWCSLGVPETMIDLRLLTSRGQMTTMVQLGLVILAPQLARSCIDSMGLKQYHVVLRRLDSELCKHCLRT